MTTDLLWHMATATERPGVDRVGSMAGCGLAESTYGAPMYSVFVGITELLLWGRHAVRVRRRPTVTKGVLKGSLPASTLCRQIKTVRGV